METKQFGVIFGHSGFTERLWSSLLVYNDLRLSLVIKKLDIFKIFLWKELYFHQTGFDGRNLLPVAAASLEPTGLL